MGLSRRALLACMLGASAWCVPGRARAQGARSLVDGLRGALDATAGGAGAGRAGRPERAAGAALGKAEAAGRRCSCRPAATRSRRSSCPAARASDRRAGTDAARLPRRRLHAARPQRRTAAHGRRDARRRRPAARSTPSPACSTPTTVDDLVLDDCAFAGSAAGAVRAPRLRRPRRALAHRAARDDRPRPRCSRAAWRSTDNVVADCGDTGILVGRDEEGADDTIVRGNRVSGIRADSGGTGQYGNGINLDKANGVIVADNRIDDCAFSAIRCFSSDNVQVTGNIAHALRRDGDLCRVRLRGRDRRRTT